MACSEAPGLVVEKNRLAAMGVTCLGIIGDPSHSYGFHLCFPPAGDYSLDGPANQPVGDFACAIDVDMRTFPAGRLWLQWLIEEIREDRITGVFEVIGSFDGVNVRYWSDDETPQWQQQGVDYNGDGHDTWVHIGVYRSSPQIDHKLLAGWTKNGQGNTPPPNPGGTTMGDWTPLQPPPAVKLNGTVRGDSVMIADNWGHEMLGHSPWGPEKSYRGAQLQRIEDGVRTLVDRDAVPVELNDADLAAIAEMVTDRLLAGTLADAIAEKVAEKIAARMQE